MRNVTPCRPTNAIQVVAFAVELEEQWNEASISEVKKVYESIPQLNEDLVRVEDITSHTVQVSHKSSQRVTSSSLGGVKFDRVNSKGEPEWGITFRDNTAYVICSVYTSWAEIMPKALGYFAHFLPVLEEKLITNVVLEYLDRFDVSTPESDWQRELFNLDSFFLPNSVLSKSPVWHCHQGFYDEVGDDRFPSVLNRIEIDSVLDNSKKLRVFCKTHHSCPLRELTPFSELVDGGVFENVIESAHEKNKSVMRDLLTEEMQTVIGLKNIEAGA